MELLGLEPAAVVTHCGHGTTIKALAAGVPIVCLPMGRDQFDVAAGMVHRGAGTQLDAAANPAAISATVRKVLSDSRYRRAAARIAEAILALTVLILRLSLNLVAWGRARARTDPSVDEATAAALPSRGHGARDPFARSGTQSMSAGLAALLDDVAALTRAAAASVDDVAAGASRASMKAAGVIVDDAAVTPRYVQGFRPDRELPMIRRIAVGSLRNKLLLILPAALALSALLPWLLTPILMIGGTYLCYEGTEKLWEAIHPHAHAADQRAVEQGPDHENALVGGAIRTDFILSAEIMVISLNEVADEPFLSRALILVVVALAITALVYGAVGLIVKMDDVGVRLMQTGRGFAASFGRALVRAMPIVMSALSTVGIAAMLWVGGHILLVGLDDVGISSPYDLVHDLEHGVDEALGMLGGLGAWLTNTVASAVLGLVVGAVVVAAAHRRSTRS